MISYAENVANDFPSRTACVCTASRRWVSGPETKTFYTLDDSGKVEVDGKLLEKCANAVVAQCNWLVEWTGHPELCASCTLTRTRPADADTEALKEFGQAESAKRRLVLELNELGLPISGYEDNNVNGPAFDLLSSASESVVTGPRERCDHPRSGRGR